MVIGYSYNSNRLFLFLLVISDIVFTKNENVHKTVSTIYVISKEILCKVDAFTRKRLKIPIVQT